MFSTVTLAVAKPRVAWTDAQTRERFGDALGAAARYSSLRATVMALRLRLSVAQDDASRNDLKTDLLAFIRGHSGSADARTAVDVIDKAFANLTPSEELIVARGISATGPPARGIAAFERARTESALLTLGDRLLYAQVLSRAGRTRDAATQFDAVQGPLAAQAAYQRARMFLTTGTGDATRAAPVSPASFRATPRRPVRRCTSSPTSSPTPATTMRRARCIASCTRAIPRARRPRALDSTRGSSISSTTAGCRSRSTACDADALVRRRNCRALLEGRAWPAGNDASAHAMDGCAHPATNLVLPAASARRLGQSPWTPPASRLFPTVASVGGASYAQRFSNDSNGREARFEYDAAEAAAAGSPDRLLATAHAFLSAGQASRAMRLAQKVIDAGSARARVPSPLSRGRSRGASRDANLAVRSGARRRADSPGVELRRGRCRSQSARVDASAPRGRRGDFTISKVSRLEPGAVARRRWHPVRCRASARCRVAFEPVVRRPIRRHRVHLAWATRECRGLGRQARTTCFGKDARDAYPMRPERLSKQRARPAERNDARALPARRQLESPHPVLRRALERMGDVGFHDRVSHQVEAE